MSPVVRHDKRYESFHKAYWRVDVHSGIEIGKGSRTSSRDR
jgi:hypothetical protein